MKKFKKISYLVLIIIIAILLVVIYSTISAGSSKNEKSKALAEVEFLEMKLETMLNQMNNIETRNYDVSVSEISKQKQSQQSGGTSEAESSEEGANGGGSSKQGSSKQGGSSDGGEGNDTKKQESSSSGNSQSSETSKKFELEPIGVLSTSQDVKWGNIKNEIEILYSSIPTITLDLYQLNVSQEDVLGFNKEFDTLTTIVKSENKEEALASLSKLYEFIPKFLQNATDDEVDKVIANTKNDIFKAYSKLDSKNWEEIGKDTKQAIDKFSKLLSSTNIEQSKQYKISKTFVMVNELQNAVEVQDESVFLIKYKNILEEINNIW